MIMAGLVHYKFIRKVFGVPVLTDTYNHVH